MSVRHSDSANPFRWYVGRRVTYRDRLHVVEGYELRGRDLFFRLRPVGPGREGRVTVLELMELMDRQRR